MDELQKTETETENENKTTATESEKKPLFGDSSFSEILVKIRQICCFVAIITTVGLAVHFLAGKNDVLEIICDIIVVIGLAAALIAAPIKVLSFPIKLCIWGWKIVPTGVTWLGLIISVIVKLMVLSILVYSVFVPLCIPAAITLYYYFTELRYK